MSEERPTGSECIAYPTMGVILLGGVSEARIPRHTSAGIAYTNSDLTAYSLTRLFLTDTNFGIVNGKRVEENSNRSPFRILREYEKLEPGGGKKLAFFSENKNIISGSSDSGAAAMATCIRELFQVADSRKLEDEFRIVSESIGRSLLGGLTLTVADGERAKTDRLLGPGAFEGYSIVAFKFSSDRHPSDRIHENVVVNPGYPDRVRRTDRKAEDLHSLAREKNIEGIFELAMEDTDEYHSLVESSGVQVITDGMKKLQTRIRQEIRFWKTYIITGGTNVFVPCRDSDAERVKKLGDGLASGVEVLKVAGKAHRYINF